MVRLRSDLQVRWSLGRYWNRTILEGAIGELTGGEYEELMTVRFDDYQCEVWVARDKLAFVWPSKGREANDYS